MPSLPKRVSNLEDTVQKHLIESGGIKADLQSLKSTAKAHMVAELSLLVTVAGAIVGYLLKH